MEIPDEDDKKAVRAVMEEQEAAWNNGDFQTFMEGYWKSDSMRFVGRGGPSYGWNTLLEMYQKSFPNRDDMGQLSFDIKQISASKPPYLWVDGNWSIDRGDSTIDGNFVLIFEEKEEEWKIIEDHTW